MTPGEILAIAEGVLRAGKFERARELFAFAQSRLGGGRSDIAVWEGLAACPSGRTGTLIGLMDTLQANRMSTFVSEGLATWLKILPFLEDVKFRDLAKIQRVASDSLHW